MKAPKISLLVFIVFVVGAVFALPKMIPLDKIESEAKTKFKEVTGREIAFATPEVAFWPNVGVKLKDVSISNPSWAKDKNLIQLGEMDVSLAVMPLLQRQIEVKTFTLKSPVISLEKSSGGKTSWGFSMAATNGKPASSGGSSGDSAMKDFKVKLGDFKITDGKLVYRDDAAGKTETIEKIDMTISMPDLESALALEGSLEYKLKKVGIRLNIDKPMDMAAGKSSNGRVEVSTDDLSASVAGNFASSGTFVKGDIDAKISSLPKMLAWVTGAAEQALPFTRVSFKSGADVSASAMKLDGATLSLDDISAGGNVTVNYGGTKPDIYARLAIDKIDLDRFMGKEAGAAGDAATQSKKEASQDWDDTPIDFSGLKAVNADVILQTKGFSLKGVDVGASNLTVQLKNGDLAFTSSEASLFDGKFSSQAGVNASSSVPTMKFNFKMDGVQAKPVLTTFADFTNLSGAADASVAVTASGTSQKQIVNALNGNGAVVFRDGSLEGIDLVNIAKMIQSKLTDMNVGSGKTDFVELGGTFTIAKGVALNKDLKMKGPLVQAAGEGTVDLPRKYIQYRVVPVLTASSAVDNASGIKVPVDIKGDFSNIKIKPDYASMVSDLVNNPDQIKSTVKNVKEQIAPLKDNLKDIKKDPAKALQGLLGGGLLGGAVAPQEAPTAPITETAPAAPEATAPATMP